MFKGSSNGLFHTLPSLFQSHPLQPEVKTVARQPVSLVAAVSPAGLSGSFLLHVRTLKLPDMPFDDLIVLSGGLTSILSLAHLKYLHRSHLATLQ